MNLSHPVVYFPVVLVVLRCFENKMRFLYSFFFFQIRSFFWEGNEYDAYFLVGTLGLTNDLCLFLSRPAQLSVLSARYSIIE